jgi:nucleotide-binding universal stress UspA family protein
MYSKIVVGTDGSPTAAEAVRQAGQLARTLDAELVVVHGVKLQAALAGMHAGVPPDIEGAREEGEEILRGATADVGSDVRVRAVMREGDPGDAIINQAQEEGADLIVVGNRGMRGPKRFVLGSVPNHISHHAPCNVLIVHTT